MVVINLLYPIIQLNMHPDLSSVSYIYRYTYAQLDCHWTYTLYNYFCIGSWHAHKIRFGYNSYHTVFRVYTSNEPVATGGLDH